jgi:hypothetical protein
VLFGSCRQKSRFVLDTVFVVVDHVDHDADQWRHRLDGRVSNTYRAVTIEPWYQSPLPEDRSHRLYFGATPERPIGPMFSFFPCQPYDARACGFARPEIHIPGYMTPHLTQGKKITRDLALAQLSELWEEVVRQIVEQGLALGVHAELPPRRVERAAIQDRRAPRARC